MNLGIALAQSLGLPFLQMGWDGNHANDWGWAGWLIMSIFMVVFWGTIVGLGIWLVRSISPHSHPEAGSSALDIARDRYARGEISDEEFQRIKAGLSR